jgi:peptidoglycan/xylan/chitin deacetylase (PgdA/CDA1 family)
MSLKKIAKSILLNGCKYSGVFALARHLTRDRIRILCYHGISHGDQHLYEPLLYMQRGTFERRMRLLRRRGWRILSLDDAVAEMRTGRVHGAPAVVTIDDGWRSTLSDAAPVLKQLRIPATLYITTYYVERAADVFNVVVHYMLWKNARSRVVLRGFDAGLYGAYDLTGDRHALGERWVALANERLDWQGRQALLAKLAQALDLSIDEVLAGKRFRIVERDEIRALQAAGIDVQLHTHRHRLPDSSYEAMQAEVADNKRLLDDWTGQSCDHFCYPSGLYTADHPEWLERMGLKSATTCDPGLNDRYSNPFLLNRILDRNDWTDLEFEAALSGLFELVMPGRFGPHLPEKVYGAA